MGIARFRFFSASLFVILIVSFNSSFAQEYGRLRGFLTDSTSGEALAFANVYIKDINLGASSNERGIFLINKIPDDKNYDVTFSYVGYKTKIISVFIKPGDEVTQLDVQLVPLSIELHSIEKIGDKYSTENRTDLGLKRISIKELEILPKGVETDVFRSLQLLPGISTTGDVTAKYYVRGGGGDQNLILINGIELYNPFHSLGLFSVLDPDIINSIKFYKGGFTSEYSGHLSSVMDIISKDGNKKLFGGKGSISLLTMKGVIDGPIPNGSFIISGRRSYNNNILKKFFNENTVPIDFYDLSFKLNYSSADIFENAKFSIFGFSSSDNVNYNDPLREGFKWKNSLFGFEWLQVYDTPIFSRLGISSSNFNGEVIPNLSSMKPRKNDVRDVTIKFDLNTVYASNDEMQFGLKFKILNASFYQLNNLRAVTDIERFAGNMSIYGKYRFLQFKDIAVDFGSRYNVTGLSKNGDGTFEPRVSITYNLFPAVTLKGSWGIYYQEIVTVSDEEEIISVFEPWIIIPDYMDPAFAIHYNAGIDFLFTKGISCSVEGYYKILKNLPIVNNEKFLSSDPDLLPGAGESYGWEFLFNYGVDPFNFSTSYTLSWAYKEVNGWTYYPKYDARHALNVILEYNLGAGWVASAVWNYSSGHPFTELVGYYDKYFLNNTNTSELNYGGFYPYPILGDRNLGRLPAYHRLDLSLSKKLELSFVKMEVGLSAINVYNRKNIFYFNRDTGEIVNMLPFLFTGTFKVEL